MSSKSEAYRAKSILFRERAEQTTDEVVRTFNALLADSYAGLARHQEWLAKCHRDLERMRNGLGPLPIDMVDRLPPETVSR